MDGGKCVTSADLFPIFYINRDTGCILLNVAATTATDLLYIVPCDEQHEYLCESPIRGMSIIAIPHSCLSLFLTRHIYIFRLIYIYIFFTKHYANCIGMLLTFTSHLSLSIF